MTDPELYELEMQAVREQEAAIAERRRKKQIESKKPVSEDLLELPDLDDVNELLKIADPETIKLLYKMMYNGETPAATRARIAEILLSYSRGKPAQEGNKKPAEDAKPTKIGGLKEKILKAIPNDKLDELIRAIDSAGNQSGED